MFLKKEFPPNPLHEFKPNNTFRCEQLKATTLTSTSVKQRHAYDSKGHSQVGVISAHRANAQCAYMLIRASQPSYRLGETTLMRLVSSSPRLRGKEVSKSRGPAPTAHAGASVQPHDTALLPRPLQPGLPCFQTAN